jgi:uncharacterized protein
MLMKRSLTPQKTMIKIVVDTNLFISVFVFPGQMVKTIFELVMDEKLVMVVSVALIRELKKKLDYFKVPQQVQMEILFFIENKSTLVEPTVTINESRDKKDNFLLELSETAKANYLVTRDKDLLVVKNWKDTIIFMPEDFLPNLRKMGIL